MFGIEIFYFRGSIFLLFILIQCVFVYVVVMKGLEKRIFARQTKTKTSNKVNFKATIKLICRYPQRVLGPQRIGLSVEAVDEYLTVMSEGLSIAESGCEAAIVEIGKSKTLVALKASDTRRKDKVLVKIMPKGKERILHIVAE